VERANTTRLYALPGETHGYTATDGGILQESAQREKLLSNFMAPKQLQLRINSQVMMIKNTDDTLVNGSMGSVIDFLDPASHAKGMTSEDVMEQDMRDAEKPKKKAGDAQVLKKYPMVRFAVAGGGYKDVLVQQETWKVELPNGEVQVSRSQVRLFLTFICPLSNRLHLYSSHLSFRGPCQYINRRDRRWKR
jgi:ATP-dependent DNA helicase PIF1